MPNATLYSPTVVQPADEVPTLDLEIYETFWRIRCGDEDAADLIAANFSEFLRSRATQPPFAVIEVTRARAPAAWEIQPAAGPPITAEDSYDLLFFLEQTITADVQDARPDLLFFHSAVLAYRGAALLLVASSGSGKSTTTWALANRGFAYLSDELAAIRLTTLEVEPYAHALCLKAIPPEPFDLPDDTVVTSRSLHVPARSIPTVVRRATPIKAIFFNRYDPFVEQPRATPMSPGAASAQLYMHALNPRAHRRVGLEGVATIGLGTHGYELITSDLEQTCQVIRATMDELLVSNDIRN